MSNLISILGIGWFSLLVFCCYCLLVGILAEFTLGQPKVNQWGELRVKKDCFIIKNLFVDNFSENIHNKKYPKNFCHLIRGLFFGIPLSVVFGVFAFILLYCIICPISFIFGFVLDEKKSSAVFKPYQTYGKNYDKKFIAPWKILLPLAIGYLFIPLEGYKIFFAGSRVVGSGIVAVGTSSVFWSIIGGISFLVAFIAFVFYVLQKPETKKNWAVACVWIKTKKTKICPMIEIVDE